MEAGADVMIGKLPESYIILAPVKTSVAPMELILMQ